MENMSLASKCREATTQVLFLKQELANCLLVQKQDLARQRQETQRELQEAFSSGTLVTTPESQESSYSNETDRPLLDNSSTPTTTTTLYSTPKKQVSPNDDDDDDDLQPCNSSSSSVLFPHSASPNLKHSSSTAITMNSSNSHLDYKSPECNVAIQPMETDSDTNSLVTPTNSKDAFEASFDTTFPSNFSSPTLTKSKNKQEPYNPFALKSPDRNSIISPPSDEGSPQHATRQEFCTPPRTNNHNKPTSSSQEEEPKRPEKTPSAAARARYEKAMQPRTSSSEESTTPNHHQETNNTKNSSPSPLLKRIQQKRANKRLQRQQSAPESMVQDTTTTSHKPLLGRQSSAPLSTNKEDPFVSAASRLNSQPTTTRVARLQELKSHRRSVKQPISYAEPALNTKLRQGDVYFQKQSSEL